MTGPAPAIECDQDLTAALDVRSIKIDLQPIIDLRRLEVAGYEALARFDGPLGRRPDQWFRAAREAGVTAQLDAAILNHALSRRADLPARCFLTVNLEPDSVGSRAIDDVLSCRSLHGVVLELTEHAPVESYEELLPALDRYRANGALIAIDDAGAGYAGLQHILNVRPAFLKLDRSLVEGLHRDGAKAALIETLGTFTDRIDAWIIAEGVEDEGEARALSDLGVPLAQGYFFGRPAPDGGSASLGLGALLRYRDLSATEPLRPLLQEAPCVHAPTGRPIEELVAQHGGRLTVVLDERGCPLGTTSVPAGDAEARQLQPSLRASLRTSPLELAQRIAALPAGEQHLPVTCCDEAGHYVGIVTPGRLLQHLVTAEPNQADLTDIDLRSGWDDSGDGQR